MNLLKTEVGKRIEETTDDLRRKHGVTKNFYKFLNQVFESKTSDDENENGVDQLMNTSMSKAFLEALGKNMKSEVLEVILRVMVRSIRNRSAYSNDMLHIAFDYEVNRKSRLPKDTLLFTVIKSTILEILADTKQKKDWFWMYVEQNYILQSSIWYEKIDPNDIKSSILWFEVFAWVNEETQKQSKIVGETMREIEEKNEEEWDQFVKYDVETKYEFDNVRQDVIPRGLKAEYTKDHLIQNVSLSAHFNPIVHYDLSQYLTKLILVCHEADDKFQRDIQKIFAVDKDTNENKELGVLYMKGPVKRLERCYAKCQSDYRDERFPTAAHVLDIIRCTLVFTNVSSMLSGMDLFQERIRDEEVSIKEIVRVKNGFTEYSHESATYTDIKFNAIVSGREYDIIAEIQFLFTEMSDYKKIAHSLYSIERRREFVDNMTKIKGIKLDLTKQLFIHAARDNIKGLTDLMVTNDFNNTDLLQLNQRNQSILTPIMTVNSLKTLSFLLKQIDEDEMKERLVRPDMDGNYPLSLAVINNHFNGVLKSIIDGDKLGLADYETPSKEHLASNCWVNKRGKVASLILRNINNPQRKLKLIEKEYTLHNILRVEDANLLQFVWNQLQSSQKVKDKWLEKRGIGMHYGFNNLHVACSTSGDQGGSVDCVKTLLSFYDDEKECEALWIEPDYVNLTPLVRAVLPANYNILEWRLNLLNENEKEAFFAARYHSRDIFSWLLNRTRTPMKKILKSIEILVFHSNTSFQKKFPEIFLFVAKNDAVDTAKVLLAKVNEEEREKLIKYCDARTLDTALHYAARKNHVEFAMFLLNIISADNDILRAKNQRNLNPLMEAARSSALRITKAILEKVKDEKEILNDILGMRCKDKLLPINHAIRSSHRNNIECAKIIMSYYGNDSDPNQIFLPSLELGDLKMAQKLWDRTKGDEALQKKMMETEDSDGYNCLLMACKNGQYDCLKWLLSLNNRNVDEAEEDGKNLMKQNSSGMNALLLVTSNDIRKKNESKSDGTELSSEQQHDYFKCAELILSTISSKNKTDLLKETDNSQNNALMWCCRNGNLQSATYILGQCPDDKMKEAMINQRNDEQFNCFHESIVGGNKELTRMIHDVFKSFKKDEGLIKDDKALRLALEQGVMDDVEWILFDLIKDSRKRLEFLNGTILKCKKGRKTEDVAKRLVTRIMENDLYDIRDQKDINHVHRIFEFMMLRDDSHCVKLMLKRLSVDEETKKNWFLTIKCLEYATQNRPNLLRQLLGYLGDYYQPLLDMTPNALISAINNRSEECVSILLSHVTSPEIKDQMIATKEVKTNALIACVKQDKKELVKLLVANHSNIEPLLGVSFRSCLMTDNKVAAELLLNESINKSSILNEKGDYKADHHGAATDGNYNVLMFALQRPTVQCLELIRDELNEDIHGLKLHSNPIVEMDNLSRESTRSYSRRSVLRGDDDEDDFKAPLVLEHDLIIGGTMDSNIHPMYFMTTDYKNNIFHELMKHPEGALSQLTVLGNVLKKEQIETMLLSRNMNDELPLHCIASSAEIEVLSWIFDKHFEDETLLKFNMIAARNRFGNSPLRKVRLNKSPQDYLAEKLYEFMNELDFEEEDYVRREPLIDFTTIADVFRHTIGWKNPKIQQLILEKVDESQHVHLLSGEYASNMFGSILNQLVEADHEEMTQTVLPIIRNERTFLNGSFGNIFVLSIENKKAHKQLKIMIEAIQAPSIKYRLLSECGWRVEWTSLSEAYSSKLSTMITFIISHLANDQLFYALNEAMRFNEDKEEYVKKVLNRASSDDERRKLLRGVNVVGRTMFAQATYLIKSDFKRREIMQFFLDEVMKTKEDSIYFLTTPSVMTMENPLRKFVDVTPAMDLFEQFMNRLSPQQRIEQLVFQSYDGSTMLTKSQNEDYQLKLAEIMDNTLNAIETPIDDFDTLWALFIFCFNKVIDSKYVDRILSKAPETMKHRLMVNYECGRNHNVMLKLMDRGNEKEDKEMMDVVMKHIEKSKMMDVLNDVTNPKRGFYIEHESVMEMVVKKGDDSKFSMFKEIYTELKEDVEAMLTKKYAEGDSLLYRSIEAGDNGISKEILNAFDSDATTMEILNMVSKNTKKNVFAAASTNDNKALLKETVTVILGNINTNQLNVDVFIPYFHWLIMENDLESIKALFEIFKNDKHSITKMMDSQLPDQRNVIAVCCGSDSNVDILELLLSNVRDKDLRSILLMNRDEGNRNVLQSIYMLKRCGRCICGKCKKNLQKIQTKHCYEGRGLYCDGCRKYIRDPETFVYHCSCSSGGYDLCLQCAGKQLKLLDVLTLSKKCETTILQHVLIKDRTLLIDVLSEDDYAVIRRHVSDKDELIKVFEYCEGRMWNIDLIHKLLIECTWSSDKDEIRAVIMKKAKEFGATELEMFDYVDPQTGNIPLFECMIKGNKKQFDIILGSMDLEDKDIIDYLIGFRNYNDENLLHAACKAPDDRLVFCRSVLGLCQFQMERDRILLGKDINGNNPLQLFLSLPQTYEYGNKDSRGKDDNKQLVNLLMETIKREDIRTQLLMDRNTSNKDAATTFMQKLQEFPDGIELYKKKMLGSINSSVEEKDIPIWASLLHITLINVKNEKDMMAIVPLIINKYEDQQMQIKLLKHSDQNTEYQNVFDVLSLRIEEVNERGRRQSRTVCGSQRLWEYFLRILFDEQLILKPDKEGKSPLFRLFSGQLSDITAYTVLQKFEDTATLMMTKDDSGKTLMEQSSGSVIAKHLRYLEEDKLAQFLIDNMTSSSFRILFLHAQEQVEIRDNLLHELLFNVKRQSDGASFLMVIIHKSSGNQSLLNWIWPYITGLEEGQIESLLAHTDDGGDTVLTHFIKACQSVSRWQDMMALFASDESKKHALLLTMNYRGENWFDKAMNITKKVYDREKRKYVDVPSPKVWIAHDIWTMKGADGDDRLFSAQERLQMVNTRLPEWDCSNKHWRKWVQRDLDEIDHIDDVALLLPLWKSALNHYDVAFAKLILSKLERNNTEEITRFLTAKALYGEQTAIHMAAMIDLDRVEMMELLLSLADDANVNMGTILLDSVQCLNHLKQTPLMVAVQSNNRKIANLIISRLSSKKERQKLLLMDMTVSQTLNHRNWLHHEQHAIRRNVFVVALQAVAEQTDYLRESTRMPMVKLLVESCDDIKVVMKYKNSIKESIFHYLITKEICEFFKMMKVNGITAETWSHRDVNGVTPFMKALQVSGDRSKREFVQWIFENCCKNTDERLKLIYQYDNDGVMALEKVSGVVMHFLINFIKSKCVSKSIKDVDKLIPLYLYALKTKKLDLAKWTLSLLSNPTDRKKLVNGSNELGVNTVFAAIQSGSMMVLNFVLNLDDFAENIIFNTDPSGLSSLHYAVKTAQCNIFKKVLSIYEQNEKGDFKTLMFEMKDNAGNNPFTLAIKQGIDLGDLYKWIMSQFGDDLVSKLKLLFSENKNKEVPLIEGYQTSEHLDFATDYIYEYFTKNKVVNDNNAVFAGRALNFLARFEGKKSMMRMIIDAAEDKSVLNKVLSVVNTSNNDILYVLGHYDQIYTLKWFLDEVVPDDHPCLYSQCSHSGKTVFMELVKKGKIDMAQRLLDKVTDKKLKLQLLKAKTLPGCYGDESALNWAQRRNIKPVIGWLMEQIADAE